MGELADDDAAEAYRLNDFSENPCAHWNVDDFICKICGYPVPLATLSTTEYRKLFEQEWEEAKDGDE